MKTLLTVGIFSLLMLVRPVVAQINDMDTELSQLSIRLTAEIKLAGKQKVAVIDFTDLDGGVNELGRYVSEQLTVDLVMNRNGFSVLDRANLKRILAEHKLTESGLVDPDTAKKLGQFAGVDALILGTITPQDKVVNVTAKVIATDTAEIVGASKAKFKSDSTGEQLKATPATGSGPSSASGGGVELNDDKPKVVQAFGSLVVELQTLRILKTGEYFLTMTLTNRSTRNSLWVALANKTTLINPNGDVYGRGTATGLFYPQVFTQNGPIMYESFKPATEIKPGDSTTATIVISSTEGRPATPGLCTLQLQFLLADKFDFSKSSPELSSRPNLVTKFEAK